VFRDADTTLTTGAALVAVDTYWAFPAELALAATAGAPAKIGMAGKAQAASVSSNLRGMGSLSPS